MAGVSHEVERVFQAQAAEQATGFQPRREARRYAQDLGFHLVDVTMMYAPRSGGVKRYLLAKRAWLDAHRRDIVHTIVAPGPRTGASAEGHMTIAAARLPFGDGYRMPASVTKWADVISDLSPDVIEAGDVFVPGLAAWPGSGNVGAKHETLNSSVKSLRSFVQLCAKCRQQRAKLLQLLIRGGTAESIGHHCQSGCGSCGESVGVHNG